MSKKSLINRLESAANILETSNSKKFIPGETFIPTGLAIYGVEEMVAMVEALASEKLGLSIKGTEFEKAFAKYCEVDYCTLTNSGSSGLCV